MHFFLGEKCVNFVSATLSKIFKPNEVYLALAAQLPEELLVLKLAPLIRDHPRHLERYVLYFADFLVVYSARETVASKLPAKIPLLFPSVFLFFRG